jgi:hypothetical protein
MTISIVGGDVGRLDPADWIWMMHTWICYPLQHRSYSILLHDLNTSSLQLSDGAHQAAEQPDKRDLHPSVVAP